MAGFVPSPNTVKVLLKWSIHGRPQLNVLHAQYSIAGPLNPNVAQNIYAAISTAIAWTSYASHLATTTQLTGVGVTDIRSASNPEVPSTGLPVAGTSAAKALPDSTSLVLTLRTALTGKSHRGRIYTLGWDINSVLPDGTADPNVAISAQQWYQQVYAALSTQSLIQAIRSPALPVRPAKPGGTLPAKDYEITPITSIDIRDHVFDSNRRRSDQLHR